MDSSIMRKADVGALEVKLFTGKATLSETAQLLEIYAAVGNSEQTARVRTVLERRLARDEFEAARLTLYVKPGECEQRTDMVHVFPFAADVFLTDSTTQGVARLAQLLQKPLFREVVVDRQVTDPQVIRTIRRLCLERRIPCRVVGTREEVVSLTGQVLPSGADAAIVAAKLDMPSEIMLPTFMGRCNIRCRFCEQAFRDFPSRQVDLEVFHDAVRAIPERVSIKTGLTPFQEPLAIYKQYRPYLALALKERPDANMGFNTNGSLLTAEKSRQLVDMGLKYLIISLNMPDRESYKWFTGKDFFDVIGRNIRKLHEIRTQANSRFPHTVVQFLKVFPVTGNEKAIRATWAPWCDDVYFRNVSAPTGDPAKVRELKERCPDLIETQQRREEAVPCSSMFHTCAIDMLGYYTPCCLVNRTRKEAGNRKYKFLEAGHVRDMDVLTAWRSPKWQQLRAWQIAGLIPQCRDCNINQTDVNFLDSLSNGVMAYCNRAPDLF